MILVLFWIFLYVCDGFVADVPAPTLSRMNKTYSLKQDMAKEQGLCLAVGTVWVPNKGCVCQHKMRPSTLGVTFDKVEQSCQCALDSVNTLVPMLPQAVYGNLRYIAEESWTLNRIVAFQDFNIAPSRLLDIDPICTDHNEAGTPLTNRGSEQVSVGGASAGWDPLRGLDPDSSFIQEKAAIKLGYQ
eukprot:Platyproteum_vivax@DN15912_c0_g1_i1.p1